MLPQRNKERKVDLWRQGVEFVQVNPKDKNGGKIIWKRNDKNSDENLMHGTIT